jgi:hypothetical protein
MKNDWNKLTDWTKSGLTLYNQVTGTSEGYAQNSTNLGSGQGSWLNLSDVTGSTNGTGTTCTSSGLTAILVINDFGLDVPTGATIDGVEVTLTRKASTGTTDDNRVGIDTEILNNITFTGTSQLNWDTDWSAVTYGDSGDTWYMSLIPNDVNNRTR